MLGSHRQSRRPVFKSTVTIVVPTYKEAESLPLLLERLGELRKQWLPELETIVVDDNSQDGTVELFDALDLPWAQLIVRTTDRGLSQSVLAGMKEARGDVLVVMDADLSHPPEVIPQMLAAIADGADFVLGSRYVLGGTTDHGWGALRWVNSQIATIMARPLTKVTDPMSGFFALPKSVLQRAENPSPLGYKIGLELLVRCKCTDVRELPIHFSNRTHGESKLTVKQQLLYLRHIGRLYRFKLLGR